jgi:hypothetical protein
LLFRIELIFVRGDRLASLDPVLKSIFDLGSINRCQNALHISKKLRIIIGTATSEFIV